MKKIGRGKKGFQQKLPPVKNSFPWPVQKWLQFWGKEKEYGMDGAQLSYKHEINLRAKICSAQ